MGHYPPNYEAMPNFKENGRKFQGHLSILSPSTIISEEAAANIARVEATKSSDNSFHLFFDPQWSREDFTRETCPDAWKTKKPFRTMSEPLDLSFLNKEPRKLTTAEAKEEIQKLLRKGKKMFPTPGGPSSVQDPINLESDSPRSGSHRMEGGADNEINSDDDNYEEPDFADGDLDEVGRKIIVTDYTYIPEPSPNPYQPTPQPELEGMSQKTIVAPFLNDDEEMEEAVPSTELVLRGALTTIPLSKETRITADPLKKHEDRNPKRHKSITKDGSMPPPNPSVVAQMCSKLGMQNATEVEVVEWCNSDMVENNAAISKCLTEAWVRQASHAKEIKHFTTDNARLTKENWILKVHASTNEEDLRKVEDRHKKELEKLQGDLKEAKSRIIELEKTQESAHKLKEELIIKHEKEIAKLNTKMEVAVYDRIELEKEFIAQGKMKFMRTFIKKLPDFDWDQLGPGNADFAKLLKDEMEEEARQRSVARTKRIEAEKAAEAKRLAEEKAKVDQAAKTNP
ncbi:hypothetical protein POM88_008980 [Heracleum sosnowskyi]|uniref:Uncharacterized protein n=1 Tax=Heracleum sosnowskyi TaxID=360622 RepID=A0AAD8JB25_9APIA|nr:hypothetical protein POM88_008980 [Heracleum sosnowskyi]